MLEPSAPWQLDGVVSDGLEDRSNFRWLVQRVSNPSSETRSHVARDGLVVLNSVPDEALMISAATAIDEVPGIAKIVRAHVAHVHLLKAPRGYDISHSEPCWSDRIFVSVPDRTDSIGTLRLAESVIHEAMHLHLSRFERNTPLVCSEQGTVFSPWRQAFRPYGGVLHGLFVFCCLREYFRGLPQDQEQLALGHIRQRVKEIDVEIAQLDLAALEAGLSIPGKTLLMRLLKGAVP